MELGSASELCLHYPITPPILLHVERKASSLEPILVFVKDIHEARFFDPEMPFLFFGCDSFIFEYAPLLAQLNFVIATMCSKIPFISNTIMKAAGCDSFKLLVNNGAAAGQLIFHRRIAGEREAMY
ncbi:hypothetical protein Ancab_022196 [Ancistrocladus abbreviatus]